MTNLSFGLEGILFPTMRILFLTFLSAHTFKQVFFFEVDYRLKVIFKISIKIEHFMSTRAFIHDTHPILNAHAKLKLR